MFTETTTRDAHNQPADYDIAPNQKVVIVNGRPEVLELVEHALDAGHYDVIFVESGAHAYSEIRRVQPELVILCVRFDENDGFQVLTMLKLDPETRNIPVVTFTTEYTTQAEVEIPEPSETELLVFKPAPRMN